MTTSSERSSGKTPSDAHAAHGLDGICLAANAMPGVAFRISVGDADLRDAVERIARHDWCATITRDWEARLLSLDAPDVGGPDPVVTVPTVPTEGWWRGYADALDAVAHAMDLPEASPRPEAVAIVGVPLDRLEPDRVTDRDEVVRLLARGVGLDVVSVWPCGEGPESLRRIAQAGLIVSLPYGREAAKTLARRTGAALVEAGLPVGLEGTARFVREVAQVVGRDPEPFLEHEMRRYAPRLEWLIPHALLHCRVRVDVDPWMAEALAAFLVEVGCRAADEGPPDLMVGPRPAVERAAAAGHAFLEAGYPSPGSHALHPTPSHFGFEGAMRLLEAIANRLAQWTPVEKVRRMRVR